jgi:hypothetical protein
VRAPIIDLGRVTVVLDAAVIRAGFLVNLDVAAHERLVTRGVAVAQDDPVLVARPRLAAILDIDPVVERPAAVDCRFSEDLRLSIPRSNSSGSARSGGVIPSGLDLAR